MFWLIILEVLVHVRFSASRAATSDGSIGEQIHSLAKGVEAIWESVASWAKNMALLNQAALWPEGQPADGAVSAGWGAVHRLQAEWLCLVSGPTLRVGRCAAAWTS